MYSKIPLPLFFNFLLFHHLFIVKPKYSNSFNTFNTTVVNSPLIRGSLSSDAEAFTLFTTSCRGQCFSTVRRESVLFCINRITSVSWALDQVVRSIQSWERVSASVHSVWNYFSRLPRLEKSLGVQHGPN